MPHERIVHVVELRPFAELEWFGKVDDDAGAVFEPGDASDSADSVAAQDNGIFGLQRAKLVKIDYRRLAYVLMRCPHAKRNAAKNAGKYNERNITKRSVRKFHVFENRKKEFNALQWLAFFQVKS